MAYQDSPIIVPPVNMVEILEVKANGSVTISYTANFADCYDKSYTKFKETEGKIHRKM